MAARKASAHGLGHLLPPYTEPTGCKGMSAPRVSLKDIGVAQWQHDLWYCVKTAALNGDPDHLDLSMLPNFDRPALSGYAATTSELLRWFKHYNQDRPYPDQVGWRTMGHVISMVQSCAIWMLFP